MSPRESNGFTVLVVDDDKAVLSTYRRLLRRSGFEALTESDSRRVLENGRTDGIDLMLLDYRMPGLDGLSLLAMLRQRECHARVILISAYLNDDVRSQARTLGVDRVLEKPVDIAALRQALNELLPISAERSA